MVTVGSVVSTSCQVTVAVPLAALPLSARSTIALAFTSADTVPPVVMPLIDTRKVVRSSGSGWVTLATSVPPAVPVMSMSALVSCTGAVVSDSPIVTSNWIGEVEVGFPCPGAMAMATSGPVWSQSISLSS